MFWCFCELISEGIIIDAKVYKEFFRFGCKKAWNYPLFLWGEKSPRTLQNERTDYLREKKLHRELAKNYFPLPNCIYQLGLSAGAIVVYGYLLYIENRETYQCHAGGIHSEAHEKVFRSETASGIWWVHFCVVTLLRIRIHRAGRRNIFFWPRRARELCRLHRKPSRSEKD